MEDNEKRMIKLLIQYNEKIDILEEKIKGIENKEELGVN